MCRYWAKNVGVDPSPYNLPKEDIDEENHPIRRAIQLATDADLLIILDLHGAPGSQNGLDNSGERSHDPRPERWGYNWLYSDQNKQDTTKILVEMAQWIERNSLKNVVLLEVSCITLAVLIDLFLAFE